jgi:hypothetical protein
MWSRRLAAAVVVITASVLGPVPTAARAATAGETVFGNFNGDGLPDSVVLGSVSPNLCSTIVRYGSAPGVFMPPIAFIYLTPGGGGTPNCPDIGVAADLNGDALDDVGVGWSQGAPAGLGFNRLILSPPSFQPLVIYTSAILRPTFFGTGVFSPGAAPTPYALGPGGIANAIIRDGTAIPGPIRFCTIDTPTAQLARWSQNGVDGVLLSYRDSCADHSSGVVRIRPNGSIERLEFDPTGQTRWTARVVNADGDRFPDVRTTNQTTGEISHFVNTGLGGMFFLVRAPDANSDTVFLTSTKAVAINVLENDYASRSATVTITVPPRYGTVQVLSDRRIIYRPRPHHGRTDRFTYQLSEEGRRASATVYLRFPD